MVNKKGFKKTRKILFNLEILNTRLNLVVKGTAKIRYSKYVLQCRASKVYVRYTLSFSQIYC
jgi:hypothetical protein